MTKMTAAKMLYRVHRVVRRVVLLLVLLTLFLLVLLSLISLLFLILLLGCVFFVCQGVGVGDLGDYRGCPSTGFDDRGQR